MKNHIARTLLVIGAGLAVVGCKTPATVTNTRVLPLPEKFAGADSLNVLQDSVQLNFATFFPDPYLRSFIDSALIANKDMQIALQRILRSQAVLRTRRAEMLPEVNAVISGGGERYGDYTIDGVGNFDTNLSPNIDKDQRIPVSPTTDVFVGLRTNWEIDIWGKMKNRKNAAIASVMATREERQFIITNLIASLAKKYYQLLALDAQLTIVRKNISIQKDGLEIVRAQKEAGRATELAVQQFAAQVFNTEAMAIALIQERIALENDMNALAGRYPAPIARDTSMPDIQIAARIGVGVPTALLSNRPDIRSREWALQAANENVKAARKAFYPSLVISPYVALNAFTPGLLFKGGSAAYGLLGGITAPVFQRGKLKAEYAMQNAVNEEALIEYRQILIDAYTEVLTSMQSVKNGRKMHTLKKSEVEQLQNAMLTARDLYVAGYANYLEVILAQRSKLEAELQLIQQRRIVFESTIDLYRSLGGGR